MHRIMVLIPQFQKHYNSCPAIQGIRETEMPKVLAVTFWFLPETAWGCTLGTEGKKGWGETFSRPLSCCSSLRRTYVKMYVKYGFHPTLSLSRARS